MKNYRELLVRELKKSALSERTHEAYIREVVRLFNNYPGISPAKMSENTVTDWLLLKKEQGYSASALNISKCGIQFFFTKVIKRPKWRIFKDFKVGKRNDRRPILSVEEVWRVLDSIHTEHNRAALTTIYLCGLRIGECVNLQVGDIHSAEGLLHVHRGKGAKSRYVPLPVKAIELLRTHWKRHRNPLLIFPARGRGKKQGDDGKTTRPVPFTSIQTVFKKVSKQVGIYKRGLSVHSLRHSYATHLLELGVPTEHVKKFLGHKHLSTTEQYIHFTDTGYKDSVPKINKLAEPYREL